MEYKYDPIMCMNVPVEKTNVKTNDKAGEMWFLYIDGKSIAAFESWGAPVKEAKEYMKKNNVKGVGTLKKIGRGGSFTITANDEKKTFIVNVYVDGKNVKFASSAMSANGAILEARKKYPQGLVWGVDRATAKDVSWKAWTLYIDGKWVKSFSSSMAPIKEAQKFMKENYPGRVGKLVRNTGSSSGYSISGSESKDSVSSVDKAIKTCDAFNVWESDEYDDIYVSYESGTYVLYAENKAQADGPKQRMIQLAKQEERMRG